MEPMCPGIRTAPIVCSCEESSATDLFARLTICVCRLVVLGQCPLGLVTKPWSALATVAGRALLNLL